MKCQICNKEYNGFKSLGTHISSKHKIPVKEYYDKFLRTGIRLCELCNAPTSFINISLGYRKTCSQKCAQKCASAPESIQKRRQTCLERYGAINSSSSPEIKEKISKTQQKRFSNPLERKKTSETTKKGTSNPESRKRYLDGLKRRNKNDEWRKKLSDATKQLHKDPKFHDVIYTKERNKKISKARKKYWESHPEEKKRVDNMWKNEKAKDEKKWRKRLFDMGKIGFKKLFNGIGETKLETKIYKFLDDHHIQYKRQYELEYKIYDAYLPVHNILLEFDGEFWHKKTLEECKYDFQVKKYHGDRRKDQIAKNHNIPLLRIRENEDPQKILDFLSLLNNF